MQDTCADLGMSFNADDLKCVLWEKLHKYVQENVIPVVCSMAQERGHEVVFTPPHHSDLQPIELVWAIVKGEVGCQYTTSTTFKTVLSRLLTSFHTLQSKTVQGCIQKANDHLKKLYEHIVMLEDHDEGSPDIFTDGSDYNDDSEDDGCFACI